MKQTAYLVGLAAALVVCIAPSVGRAQCCGDIDGDGTVAINELVTAVGYALNGCPAGGPCAGDCDGSGVVAINELVTAVGYALNGCPGAPTPTKAKSPIKTPVPSKTPIPSKTPVPTKTGTPLPLSCPIMLTTDEPTICTFQGRYNAHCGGMLDARLIANHGMVLVGVSVTGLQVSQVYQGPYPAVDFVFIEGQRGTSTTDALLAGWFTRSDGGDFILMDGLLTIDATGQHLSIVVDSWNPTTQIGDPSFDLNGCRFADYEGQVIAVSAAATH